LVTVLASGMAACTPPVAQYEIRERPLTCAQASRLAHDTLTGMGYEIFAAEPATPERAGTLRARRATLVGFEKAFEGAPTVTVRIECGPAGAGIDASEDGKWLGQVHFKRAFFLSFTGVQEAAAQQKEMDARQLAGTAPASLQRHDLRVEIEPLTRPQAQIEFGVDVLTGGILPVRIRIDNLTDRTYLLDPAEIRLAGADRTRVNALAPQDAASWLSSARHPTTGQPLVEESAADLGIQFREKVFTAERVPPRTSVQGFLFFPRGTYRNARLVLTEEESEETEGFVIEF
jgi:hypothetical protein